MSGSTTALFMIDITSINSSGISFGVSIKELVASKKSLEADARTILDMSRSLIYSKPVKQIDSAKIIVTIIILTLSLFYLAFLTLFSKFYLKFALL